MAFLKKFDKQPYTKASILITKKENLLRTQQAWTQVQYVIKRMKYTKQAKWKGKVGKLSMQGGKSARSD